MLIRFTLPTKTGSTKPDPGIFNYMIKDSKLNPAETIFVDDGVANIVIGKELGFITMQPEKRRGLASKN